MTTTEFDVAYDDYISRMYEEHKKEAIAEFTGERLSTYFINNERLAKPAIQALFSARNLITINSTAGFIFAAIAMEVGLKSILLKPIVYGLVHAESVAALITDLVVSHTGMERYRKLLLQLLQEHGGVNLDSYRRQGSNRSLWDEIKNVQTLRNGIMHNADLVSCENSEIALSIAAEILENIFPLVVKNMGLHLHDDFRICSDWKCQYKDTPFEKLINKTYPPA
jgi:hypothetical protein